MEHHARHLQVLDHVAPPPQVLHGEHPRKCADQPWLVVHSRLSQANMAEKVKLGGGVARCEGPAFRGDVMVWKMAADTVRNDFVWSNRLILDFHDVGTPWENNMIHPPISFTTRASSVAPSDTLRFLKGDEVETMHV